MLTEFPLDIVEILLTYLSHNNRNLLAVTCKYLERIINRPERWKDYTVKATRAHLSNPAEILSIQRLNMIRTILLPHNRRNQLFQCHNNLITVVNLTKFLKNLNQLPNLIELDLTNQISLRDLYKDIVAKAIEQLSIAKLNGTKLSTNTLNAILETIRKKKSMDSISLANINLAEVCPTLLSQALHKVEKVNLRACNLTLEQINDIWTFEDKKNQIKVLNLELNNLWYVHQHRLGEALHNLREFNLGRTREAGVIDNLFKEAKGSPTLKTLSMGFFYASDQPQDPDSQYVNDVAETINRLEKADISNHPFHYQSPIHLFCKINIKDINNKMQDHCLKELYLNDINLSQVPPRILSDVVTEREVCHLGNTGLCGIQTTLLILNIKNKEKLRLKDLSLKGNNKIREVNEYTLAKALGRLEKINLKDETLNTVQWDRLFFNINHKPTSLKEANLADNFRLSVLNPVRLRHALAKLEYVNIAGCELKQEELNKIIRHCSDTKTTRTLHIGENFNFTQTRKEVEDLYQEQRLLESPTLLDVIWRGPWWFSPYYD